MAGDEGFEPPNAGTRTQCLTTWRIPKERPHNYTTFLPNSSKFRYFASKFSTRPVAFK